MKEKETYNPGSGHPSHLDENEVALFAEFLRHEREDLPDELRAHVETCARCRAEIMAVADMLEEVGRQEEGHMGIGAYGRSDVCVGVDVGVSRVTRHASRMGRFTPVIRIVASLAAVVLLAWIIQLIRPEKPETGTLAGSDSSESVNPLVEPSDSFRLAQAFIPDSLLEKLAIATFRLAHDPKIQSPSNDTVFRTGDTLRIQWVPEPGMEYALVVLNNRHEVRADIESGPGSSIQWRIDLEPGLYYWKFLRKEELWKVGKFTVLETH